MRLFHGTDNAEIQRPTVLTLGVFDGLHLGHQLIMRTVVERARAVGAVPTVITFDPHPRAVLHPESAPPLLQTFDQKVEALGVLGIEQTIVVRFTDSMGMELDESGEGAVSALAWSSDGKSIAIGDEAGRGAIVTVG